MEWVISRCSRGACLVALARKRGRQRAARLERSRTQLQRRRSQRLSREKEGKRNNKFTTKMQTICMTCLNDMSRCSTAYLNDLVNLGIYSDLFYKSQALFIYQK
jgi:hypothetical protein